MRRPAFNRRFWDLLIVAGVLVTVWRGAEAFSEWRRAPVADEVKLLTRGDVLRASVRWETSPRHLVLLVSTSCPACEASAEFYKRLFTQVRDLKQARTVIVSPQPASEVRAWLDRHAIVAEQIVSVRDPAALGFTVFPSLLLVDQAGRVTDVLLRRLSDTEQSAILERLADMDAAPLDNTDYAPEIDDRQLTELSAASSVQLLDVRERRLFAEFHRPGAMNIPADEISSRAPVELASSDPVVVACSPGGMSVCRSVGRALRRLSFDVRLLRP